MSANKGVIGQTVLGVFMMLLGIPWFVRAEMATVQHIPIFFRYPLLVRGGTSMDPWQGFVLAGLLFGLGLTLVLDAVRKRRKRNTNLSLR